MIMTEADLLKALAESTIRPSATDDPGMTVSEFAIKVLHRDSVQTRKQISNALKAVKADGRLVIGRRMVEQLNGRMYPCAVYQVLAPAKPKQAKR